MWSFLSRTIASVDMVVTPFWSRVERVRRALCPDRGGVCTGRMRTDVVRVTVDVVPRVLATTACVLSVLVAGCTSGGDGPGGGSSRTPTSASTTDTASPDQPADSLSVLAVADRVAHPAAWRAGRRGGDGGRPRARGPRSAGGDVRRVPPRRGPGRGPAHGDGLRGQPRRVPCPGGGVVGRAGRCRPDAEPGGAAAGCAGRVSGILRTRRSSSARTSTPSRRLPARRTTRAGSRWSSSWPGSPPSPGPAGR